MAAVPDERAPAVVPEGPLPLELELLAWDAGKREILGRGLASRCAVVRYERVEGDLELEALLGCDCSLGYPNVERTGTTQRILHDEAELFATLPLGAARFAGELRGGRALRIETLFAGGYALSLEGLPGTASAQPPDSPLPRELLEGPDCVRATHVMERAVVGGFTLESGPPEVLAAAGSAFAPDAAASWDPRRRLVFLEGRPNSCREAVRTGKTNGSCAIPLWIRLRPVSPADASISAVPRRPLGPALVRIPGGSFWMGSSEEPRYGPRRRITLSAFELDVTEVTVAEYQDCVDAGACKRPLARPRFYATPCNADLPGREAHPVDCVSFYDAAAYCAWAGKRLPSEEEWELAARGTDGRRFPWGDAPPVGRDCWNRASSCPVGSFPQGHSPLGVDGLAGNVREWTETPFCTDPWQPCWSDTVVVRGGSWDCPEPECLLAKGRTNWGRDESATGIGFRCARTLRRRAPPM